MTAAERSIIQCSGLPILGWVPSGPPNKGMLSFSRKQASCLVDRTVIALRCLRCTVLVSRITRQRMGSDSEYQVYVVLQNWESTRYPTPICVFADFLYKDTSSIDFVEGHLHFLA